MGIKEDSAGLGVSNFYGPRNTTEGPVGNFKTEGAVEELVMEVTGDNYTQVSGTIPAGAKCLEAYIEVVEAFALGGTTPTIDIGTDGSEGTNGFDVAEADAEAVGLYVDSTFAGTWAAQLASDTTVGVALGGTTPTITSAGRMKVVVRYVNI